MTNQKNTKLVTFVSDKIDQPKSNFGNRLLHIRKGSFHQDLNLICF